MRKELARQLVQEDRTVDARLVGIAFAEARSLDREGRARGTAVILAWRSWFAQFTLTVPARAGEANETSMAYTATAETTAVVRSVRERIIGSSLSRMRAAS